MAINFNSYAIVDFETGGVGKNCQPLSIGVVILDGRRLTIKENGTFYSLIKPYDDKECIKYGLDPTDPKALKVNKLTLEELEDAPTPKQVMGNLINFMKYQTAKSDKWSAPIFTGFNTPFDYAIMQRLIYGNLAGDVVIPTKLAPKNTYKQLGESGLAKSYKELKPLKEPYKFGGETMFRPFPVIDVGVIAHMMFESLRDPHKGSLTAVKEFLGFKSEGAHNALVDCLWTAEIFVRYLRIFRQVAPEIDYQTNNETVLNVHKLIKDMGLNKDLTISSTNSKEEKQDLLEDDGEDKESNLSICPF